MPQEDAERPGGTLPERAGEDQECVRPGREPQPGGAGRLAPALRRAQRRGQVEEVALTDEPGPVDEFADDAL